MFRQVTHLGKDSVIYGLGQALQRLTSFFLIPLYTAYYTTAEFGVQEILINTSSVLTAILGLGLISATYRSYFMYDEEERRLDIIRTALTVFAVFSLAVGCVLIPLARPLSALLLSDASYSALFVVMVVFVMLSNVVSLPFAILRARGQSVRFVIYSLVQFLANMGVTIFLVAGLGRGVRGNLEGNVVGQIVALLLFATSLWELRKARFSWRDLKDMLAFGLPLVPAMLGSLSLTVADRYFLRAFSTLEEVGVYALGYKIGMVIQVFVVTPFALSWGPVMWSVAGKPYARQFYAKVLTYFSAVALYLALAVSMFGPEMVRLLSRQEAYWGAWRVLPLITLSYVLYGAYYQVSVGLNLRKKTQYLSVVVVGAAAVNLLLNFLLIPPWGMMGAAVATLASYLLLAVVAAIVSQCFYPFPYEWIRLLKLVLVLGLGYGVGRLIPQSALSLTILLKLVLLFMCPIVLWLIRFFSAEELKRAHELGECGWNGLAALLRRRSVMRS